MGGCWRRVQVSYWVLQGFLLLFSIFRFFVKLMLTCEFVVLIADVVY